MLSSEVQKFIFRPEPQHLRDTVFYLARNPLPYRKANYTLPGHQKSTLDEADDFIEAQLRSWGYEVLREACHVQAFRRDETKPKAHQYSAPAPDDPWYVAYNLYARKPGSDKPDETIILVSHKDSQSWIDSPGANDNAIGTAGNLEAARVLAEYASQRTICFLFCNEEHTPWTSEVAARNAKDRGEEIIAVFNLDGIGVKAPEDAGRLINRTGYCTPEGQVLAVLMEHVNELYGLGLEQSAFERPFPNDDDGSFVKAGYPAAVVNTGSFPYADPHYHLESDVPENCDCENAAATVRATIAAVLHLDAFGFPRG
ncbi:MAG: M28 family metallopeptidase [Armatimonadetes bacterium]|nr:M28 family metallopeptidase [Armatimonadota bacterium]